MFHLNLPPYPAKVTNQNGHPEIYDRLRKKYVKLTPEEWVRQHFVHYLIDYKHFSPGLLANETLLTLNGMTRRCDTVAFDTTAQPILIAEYKAPTIKITQTVFDQITRYNIALHVDYLIVSNGLTHYCCHMDYPNNTYRFLPDIPTFDNLLQNTPDTQPNP